MDRFLVQSALTPAGTLQAAPLSTPWILEDGVTLLYVEIVIPNGHNGLTGIKILWSGTEIIPFSNAAFIIANDEKIHVDFNNEITASAFTIVTFNTDVFDHTFYLRALVHDIVFAKNSNMDFSNALVLGGSDNTGNDALGLDQLSATVTDEQMIKWFKSRGKHWVPPVRKPRKGRRVTA